MAVHEKSFFRLPPPRYKSISRRVSTHACQHIATRLTQARSTSSSSRCEHSAKFLGGPSHRFKLPRLIALNNCTANAIGVFHGSVCRHTGFSYPSIRRYRSRGASHVSRPISPALSLPSRTVHDDFSHPRPCFAAYSQIISDGCISVASIATCPRLSNVKRNWPFSPKSPIPSQPPPSDLATCQLLMVPIRTESRPFQAKSSISVCRVPRFRSTEKSFSGSSQPNSQSSFTGSLPACS